MSMVMNTPVQHGHGHGYAGWTRLATWTQACSKDMDLMLGGNRSIVALFNRFHFFFFLLLIYSSSNLQIANDGRPDLFFRAHCQLLIFTSKMME
jgi:hypothetical protein